VPRSPDAYQPPITAWGHTWRLLVCLAIGAFPFVSAAERPSAFTLLFWLDLCCGVLSFVLVLFRRRWPLVVAVLTSAFGAVSLSAAGPGMLAAVSLATRRQLKQILLVGAVALVAAQFYVGVYPRVNENPYLVELTVNVSVIAAALAFGMYIGSRRELLWTLRERAVRAETEQELRVGQARSHERALIAREMHDVLAHRISQVSMHAAALAYRDNLTPGEVRASAAVIQQKSHEALTDLRQVLGVLRDGSGAPVMDAPQPTFRDVPGLVREAESSGMRVQYVDEVRSDAEVPAAAGRTIYRIVQEGLTNVRKHAPGVSTTVRIGGCQDEGIDITVSNALPSFAGPRSQRSSGPGTPGAGLGLVGLAERTELAGGRLERRHTSSEFTLHAWIPWTP
jgi:signal transduction histidine kinase